MSDELRAANIKVVETYLEAMNRWDFDVMAEQMAEDFRFEMLFPAPGLPNPIVGKEEMLTFQKQFADMCKTEGITDVKLDTLHGDPAEIIGTWNSDFVFYDESRSYSNTYLSRFTVRDGKIARFQENYDNIRLVRDFGGTVESPFEQAAVES